MAWEARLMMFCRAPRLMGKPKMERHKSWMERRERRCMPVNSAIQALRRGP